MYPVTDNLQARECPRVIDTHCHLDCDILRPLLPELLKAARSAGVSAWVVPSVHPDDWERMSLISRKYENVFPAYGIHPMHADLATPETLERLAELASGGVAIGETGLDPAYPHSLERQEAVFRSQVAMAVDLGLPVLVHCRKAFQATLRVLAEEGAERVGGIMHAYSGSVEMARDFIRLGFAISLSGTLTWSNSVRPRRLAREIPEEWLVFETDAPDMTPQAHRGAFNRPEWCVETVAAAAVERKVCRDELAAAAFRNTLRILPGLGQL